jgi:hypothetical protein
MAIVGEKRNRERENNKWSTLMYFLVKQRKNVLLLNSRTEITPKQAVIYSCI